MTTMTVSACASCGTMTKSAKMSCCARGGSWFKNCGGAGKAKLRHTWYEGIQACKARSNSKAFIDYQLNVGQQKVIGASQGADMLNDKAVIAASKAFAFTSVKTSSTPMSDTMLIVTSNYTSDNAFITMSARTLMNNTSTSTSPPPSTPTSSSTSIVLRGCVNLLLKVTVHINLLLFIVF